MTTQPLKTEIDELSDEILRELDPTDRAGLILRATPSTGRSGSLGLAELAHSIRMRSPMSNLPIGCISRSSEGMRYSMTSGWPSPVCDAPAAA